MDSVDYSALVQDSGEQSTRETAISSAILATGADKGSLLLRQADGAQLEFVRCCTCNCVNQTLTGQRVPAGEEVGMALQSGDAPLNPASALATVLVHNSRAFGVMTVSFIPQLRFSLNLALYYEALAKLVALLLYKQAVIRCVAGQAGWTDSSGAEVSLVARASHMTAGSSERLCAVAAILRFSALK